MHLLGLLIRTFTGCFKMQILTSFRVVTQQPCFGTQIFQFTNACAHKHLHKYAHADLISTWKHIHLNYVRKLSW